MKKLILGFFFSLSSFAFSQETFQVIAQEGLIARLVPNGKKIGKIPYGYPLNILEKGEPFIIKDNGKAKSGNWVKVDKKSTTIVLDEGVNDTILKDNFYVFSGYLIPQKDFINQFEKEISTHTAFKNFYLDKSSKCFAIKGDFFGDGIIDYLYRMIDTKGNVRLYIVDNQKKGSQIYGLGGEKDPFKIKNYNFPILMVVPKGTPISMTADKEISKKQVVKLDYDAIYVSKDENKKGKYIFRKDGKWNSLN